MSWTQEELDKKLAENPDLKLGAIALREEDIVILSRAFLPEPKGNKYHAKRTWSELCQRWFDSKAEARHGEVLHLLEREGEISNLEYQVKFMLFDKPRITITIDFKFTEVETGLVHYEDVKGVLTRDSRTKLAWLKQRYGIEVELIT